MGDMKMEKIIKERARDLRKLMTGVELKLWSRLRLRQMAGLRFRRQVPFGNYIVDFACFEPKIIIELDGSQHAEQVDYDEQRTKYLKMYGYTVLRFWNNEILNEIEDVLQMIWNVCIPPSSLRDTSPEGGRRSI
jgi:very-short-patch-repair endonuclease